MVLVNSNPATIMTDSELADATYIEPLTWEMVEKIIIAEKPDAILPTVGGQTGLNLAIELAEGRRSGTARRRTDRRRRANACELAEDRQKFKAVMASHRPGDPAQPAGHLAWTWPTRPWTRSPSP